MTYPAFALGSFSTPVVHVCRVHDKAFVADFAAQKSENADARRQGDQPSKTKKRTAAAR
jgi:hypothetical protein